MKDHRHEVIVQLLERMQDLLDPVRAGNGDSRNGMLLMPHAADCTLTRSAPPRCSCALRSLVELERLLALMRDDRHSSLIDVAGARVSLRSLWWNLNERYLRCDTVVRDVVWRAGRWQLSHGTVVATPTGWQLALASERAKRRGRGVVMRVRVVTWHPGVSAAKVACGVEWLADHWGLQAEPMLPVERDRAGRVIAA